MSAMRKMAVYLGLVEADLNDVELDDDYVDARTPYAQPRPYSSVREVRPEPRSDLRAPVRTVEARMGDPRATESRIAEARLNPTVAVREPELELDEEPLGVSDFYRITTLHPRTYNDARRIGEEFRLGTPVIMNLTEMDDVDAKRIVDFAAGLVFGLRGTIERVTNKVFLLSPVNVDVAAEARRLAQDGFFNQS